MKAPAKLGQINPSAKPQQYQALAPDTPLGGAEKEDETMEYLIPTVD